jgi:pimeloyl-ACP methyl ester carboxylesterase
MTQEETDDYLIDWFEKWRVAMGDLKGFILGGHSFGGYVCGIYACRYP